MRNVIVCNNSKCKSLYLSIICVVSKGVLRPMQQVCLRDGRDCFRSHKGDALARRNRANCWIIDTWQQTLRMGVVSIQEAVKNHLVLRADDMKPHVWLRQEVIVGVSNAIAMVKVEGGHI